VLYAPLAVGGALQGLSDAVTMTLVRLPLIASERHALALTDPSGDPSQRLLLLREVVAFIVCKQRVIVGLSFEFAPALPIDPEFGQVLVPDAHALATA
jgi:hypothetical protein